MDYTKYETFKYYFQADGFIPFTGPIAERIKKRVKEIIKNSALSDELLNIAVRSLSVITEQDLATMFATQDEHCVKCGNCCRTCSPIVASKEELKIIARHLGISYKTLKKRYKIFPRKKGQFNIPAKPCPFLRGKNFCEIYEVRPSVCRNHPTGYAVASLLEGQGLMVPKGCPSIEKMLTNTAASRVLHEIIYKEKPELYEKLSQYAESKYKDAHDKPTGERIERYIQISRELFKEIKEAEKKEK